MELWILKMLERNIAMPPIYKSICAENHDII